MFPNGPGQLTRHNGLVTHRDRLPTIDVGSFAAGTGNTAQRDRVAELLDATHSYRNPLLAAHNAETA